ncbi:hypothetical protein UPYG_G00009060 [Umbra pygmaea]|uniref:Uncharacterized protein n=1 Tax=Umbra pygmaea TaxID=75934 RepID=A0ABD0XKJ5_UMBPY
MFICLVLSTCVCNQKSCLFMSTSRACVQFQTLSPLPHSRYPLLLLPIHPHPDWKMHHCCFGQNSPQNSAGYNDHYCQLEQHQPHLVNPKGLIYLGYPNRLPCSRFPLSLLPFFLYQLHPYKPHLLQLKNKPVFVVG